jgi:predicted RNA binding protein YcfA (HicA-like mRNA interferase family)
VQRPAVGSIPQGPRLIWRSQPVLAWPCFTVLRMAKAARVLAALKRDGWIETRRSGSHRVLAKGDQQRIWAYHDGVDLGGPAMARIARDYGYTLAELRKL